MSRAKSENKSYLTPNEVAELLMVSPVTVRRWAEQGWLRAVSTLGGHRRYPREEVERFAREQGLKFEPLSREPLRILIVDDDDQFAEYLAEVLWQTHAQVETVIAHDGFDAGQKVHTFRPHIVLLDLLMPGLDGIEVCRLLKADEMTKEIRIVAMTGHASNEHIEAILSAGAEACLIKPFNKEALLEVLGLISDSETNIDRPS